MNNSDIIQNKFVEFEIKNYRCIELLGKGTYGHVYKAVRTDEKIEKFYAVKIPLK